MRYRVGDTEHGGIFIEAGSLRMLRTGWVHMGARMCPSKKALMECIAGAPLLYVYEGGLEYGDFVYSHLRRYLMLYVGILVDKALADSPSARRI